MALRAVIWVAVSGLSQAGDDKVSLKDQEDRARAKCEQEGWQITEVLRVAGFSRDYYDVREFADDLWDQQHNDAGYRLLDLWKKRGYDVLVCWDGSRFGRSQSMHARVVEETSNMGAFIYVLRTQTRVDRQNQRGFISLDGYAAANELDNISSRRQGGMRGAAARGLPMAPRQPFFHKVDRNQYGKRQGLSVDPNKQMLAKDLAKVVINGTPWEKVEQVLLDQYGHADPRTGKAYPVRYFRSVLLVPYTWGNSGYGYGRNYGMWAFDPDEQAPDGAVIFRNKFDPAFTGELAIELKAALRLRHEIRGRASPTKSFLFAGLIMCGECRSACVAAPAKSGKDRKKITYYRCNSHNRPGRFACSQRKHIREDRVIAYMERILPREFVIEHPELIFPDDSAAGMAAQTTLGILEKEQNSLETRIGVLIDEQTEAPIDVRPMYTTRIEVAAQRLAAIKREIRQISRELPSPEAKLQRRRSFEEARERAQNKIENLWKMDPREANRLLRGIMGEWRMVLYNGDIVHETNDRSVPDPSQPRNDR
jgi:DNA invertase Pin-like site-specific DNA recombinase